MGEWQRLKIGNVCDIVKGETGLASATPGQYPMVATGAERRSCNTYQFDTEAICIPLVSSTGHGKKTLNYVHYQTGKFALGTILAAVIPKDPQVLTARYLHLYLAHFKDTVLVPLMKGAANVSLPMKGIASVEIPVPPVDQQKMLIDLIGRIESEHRELLEEGNRQANLFKQLRQAVLQEAIEGKLTADWRRQHPLVKGDPQHAAAALLAQIKAEKEQLVKAGKTRKERTLHPITMEEKPFGLPQGWLWVRLGDLRNFEFPLSYGVLVPGEHVEDGIPFVRVHDLDNAFEGSQPSKRISMSLDLEYKRTKLIGGEILICVVGSIGKVAMSPDSWIGANIARAVCRFMPNDLFSKEYLHASLNSPFVQNFFQSSYKSIQPTLNVSVLEKTLIPLPPLAEQQAIVARVDSLMATIDALEAQVTERKEQAQQLMQAVLREAFAGGEEQ